MSPLPDHYQHDGLVLRRWTADDAEVLDELVRTNVEHLRPYMPWIAEEPIGVEGRRAMIGRWEAEWLDGGSVVFGIHVEGALVGSCGLHPRIGPSGIEIGYWVDAGHQGQGIATRAADGLTEIAFAVDRFDHVEIHHDLSNAASRRVPEKLGYRRAGEIRLERDLAPAETGIEWVWRVTRDQWSERWSAAPKDA